MNAWLTLQPVSEILVLYDFFGAFEINNLPCCCSALPEAADRIKMKVANT